MKYNNTLSYGTVKRSCHSKGILKAVTLSLVSLTGAKPQGSYVAMGVVIEIQQYKGTCCYDFASDRELIQHFV